MKRLANFLMLCLLLTFVVVASFFGYVYVYRDTGAVSSALLAGFTSLSPYPVSYAGPKSQESCLDAYCFLKKNTKVCLIERLEDSRYVCGDNTVFLTADSWQNDTVEAVHEFGHALDRYLYGTTVGYYSRQERFSDAYASDCVTMQRSFQFDDLFETQTYRNLPVSDILFTVFFEDIDASRILEASYKTAGVPYWRHEQEYLSKAENRQTEVFANIYAVLLSDNEEAKSFLRQNLPASTKCLVRAVEAQAW